jgi:nucleotide-binding universal stress UspA family protein
VFDKVLVGVDGSLAGRDAIALAGCLVDPDGELMLANVHAHQFSPGLDLSFDALGPEESRRLVEHERAATGVAAEPITIASTSAGRGLHELAEQYACDLLVVGSSHHGLVGRVMLGDGTRASLNGAPCAVAVAPRGYSYQLPRIEVIGVGYDGSPESETALALARRIAARSGAGLRALTVISPSARHAWGPVTELTYPAVISKLLDRSDSPGPRGLGNAAAERTLEQPPRLDDVEGSVAVGVAAEELAAFGDGIDLLIVGSRGYGPLSRLVLGSTSHHLARTARCPLLVVPRADARADRAVAEVHQPGTAMG